MKKPVSRLSTHSAEFAANDGVSDKRRAYWHTGCTCCLHPQPQNILSDFSLGERRRGGLWLILFVLIRNKVHLTEAQETK